MKTDSRPHPETARWHRATEWLVFAVPAAAGAALVALAFAGPPVGSLDGPLAFEGLLAAASARPVVALVTAGLAVVVALVWTLALAAAVYLDGVVVEPVAADWEPRGSAYAALVLVVPVAALGYLRRRHRHLGLGPGREEGSRWWLGFPAATVVLALAFVAAARGTLPPVAVLAGPGLAMTFLPVAAYRDAAHVRRVGATWRPDPAAHFVLAAVATIFAFPQPLYAGYYLLRRRRALRGGGCGGES